MKRGKDTERNNLIKKGVVVSVLLLFISVSVVSSTGTMVEKKYIKPTFYDGNILYVGGSGPGNYSSIQDAINNASEGDTVFVYSGIYYENIELNKSIILEGEDKNITIVDGIYGGNKDHVILIKKSSIRIKGFSIINGEQDGFTRGIEIRGHTLIDINISDCIIRDNGGGICFYGVYASDCSINNCIIYNNTRASISFYPIYEFCFSKNILINNCGIYNNGKDSNGGWISPGGIFIYLNTPQLAAVGMEQLQKDVKISFVLD